MASEILGLFTSPEQYNMMQQQAQQNRAAQFAQLTPMEKASYGAYKGGRGLADFGVRLFGVEDPQLRMISQRQMLSRDIDPADPESILRAAQRAGQMGDQQFALTLSDYARKAQSEMALAGQRTAQANKEYRQSIPNDLLITQERAKYSAALRELKALPPSEENVAKINYLNDVLAGLPLPGAAKPIDKIEINKQIVQLREKLRAAPKGSPESQDLQAQIDFLSGAKDEKANIREVGVATGTNKAVFLDVNNDQQFIYQTGKDGKQIRVPYDGAVDRTTAKVSASSTSVQENEFSKGLGRLQAKRYDDASSLRDNSIAALNSLDRLIKLDQNGLISGARADDRVGLTNFLDTIGVLSGSDKDRLATSQNYQKIAGDIVLATLGGRLGAGFSNEDRKFIQGLVPQLEASPIARKQLLDFLVRKNQSIVDETTRLMDYAESKRTLNGFTPKIPLVSVPRTGAQAYTDAELKAAIAKKEKEEAQGKGK